MKQYWFKLSTKIDAMSMRERVMAFVAAVSVLIFLVFSFLLNPLYAKQKILVAQFRQQQNQSAGINAEVAQIMLANADDPDRASRERLKHIKLELGQLGGTLRGMQKGLVAPDKIVLLLENILRGNSKLRLLSLKTLPATGLADGRFSDSAAPAEPDSAEAKLWASVQASGLGTAPGAAPGATPVPTAAGAAPAPVALPKAPPLLYRHGVELVLEGSYLDMVSYMEALEAMPSQLFWGKATLNAEDYPRTRLALTLYTLSLDPKWMAL